MCKRDGMIKQWAQNTCIRLFLHVVPATAFILFTVSAIADEDGIMMKIKAATRPLNPDKQVQSSTPVPKHIVKATVPYQGGVFYTDARKVRIKRFECGSCHNNKDVAIKNAAGISHANIAVQHGEKDGPIACNTCHHADDRNFLTTAKGDKIDMDHAYTMCGQCHFRQKKDWVGGAHGKRITYWAGQRVVKNCTSCHNPHSPRFEKKWPVTYSVPLK